MSYGIENVKKVMDYLYKIGYKVEKVTREDSPGGKDIKMIEFPEFFPVLMATPGMMKALPKFLPEMNDLDDAEIKELTQHAIDTYDLESERAERLVIKSIKVGLAMWDLVNDIFIKKPDKDLPDYV